MSHDTETREAAIERLGTHGAWWWYTKLPTDQVARVEELGVGTIWLGGSPKDLTPVEDILRVTSTITVATGIVNIWNTDASTIGTEFRRIDTQYPGRFILGIGAGHPETNSAYSSPYDAVNRYLDVLDEVGVPSHRRLLAALGPRMLRLSADRALGAHPYLTPSAHTAVARETLGPGVLLAPEHKAVVNSDPVAARAVGRPIVKPYLRLRNYASNLKRLGYSDDDIANEGSDKLIDALVAHGTGEAVRAQVDSHLAAGADHVAIQILGSVDPAAELATILG